MKYTSLPDPMRPKTFHRQHAGGLRQCLYDQYAGHYWSPGKMSLEKTFIYRDRFDRANSFVWDELFHAVDKQHWIAVRQHRHHAADVVIAEVARRHQITGYQAAALVQVSLDAVQQLRRVAAIVLQRPARPAFARHC